MVTLGGGAGWLGIGGVDGEGSGLGPLLVFTFEEMKWLDR